MYICRISLERVEVSRKRLYEGRRERIKTTPDRGWEIRPITGFLYTFKVIYTSVYCLYFFICLCDSSKALYIIYKHAL